MLSYICLFTHNSIDEPSRGVKVSRDLPLNDWVLACFPRFTQLYFHKTIPLAMLYKLLDLKS